MPGLDRTGPAGQGPRTGWGFGPCGGGMGWGRRGGGYGFRRFWSAKNEKAAIEDEEKMLEEELKVIREEKAVLEKGQK